MSAKLTTLGGRHRETVRPFGHGDIVVKHDGRRFVVLESLPDAYARPALACVALDTGNDAIIFVYEVAYRSVREARK